MGYDNGRYIRIEYSVPAFLLDELSHSVTRRLCGLRLHSCCTDLRNPQYGTCHQLRRRARSFVHSILSPRPRFQFPATCLLFFTSLAAKRCPWSQDMERQYSTFLSRPPVQRGRIITVHRCMRGLRSTMYCSTFAVKIRWALDLMSLNKHVDPLPSLSTPSQKYREKLGKG